MTPSITDVSAWLRRLPALLWIALLSIFCGQTFAEDSQRLLWSASTAGTQGWTVFDNTPTRTSIDLVSDDERNAMVLMLDGAGTQNGYQLGSTTTSTGGWDERERFSLEFEMRVPASYRIDVAVDTVDGFRYLQYDHRAFDRGLYNRRFVHHGLGGSAGRDGWFSFKRDLSADLVSGEPGNALIAVHGLFVRGDMRINEVALAGPAGEDVDADSDLSDEEIADAGDPTHNGEEAGEEAGDTGELATENMARLLWDASTGGVQGWTVFDNTPTRTSIEVALDGELGESVVVLDGSGTQNGYQLGATVASDGGWDERERFQIQFDMRVPSSYRIDIAVETTGGFRYLHYDRRAFDRGFYGGRFVHHGLGAGAGRNGWFRFARNLSDDLQTGEPGNSLIAVHGLFIRGDMRLTTVSLLGDSVDGLANLPPVAIAGDDVSVFLGASISLDGSASSDSDGSIVSWEWKLGDGTLLGRTPEAIFSPTGLGSFEIFLSVTDDNGAIVTDSVVVEVAEDEVAAQPNLGGFNLVFSDEFDGDELDPAKWGTALLWGPYLPINNEQQMYVDSLGMHADNGHSPFDVSGGTLKITADPVSETLTVPERPPIPEVNPTYPSAWKPYPYSEFQYNGPTVDSEGNVTGAGYSEEDIDFLSGIITSYGSFNMTRGYVEMRGKLPEGQGLWPAFWLLPMHYVEDVPEIDVMEFLGHDVSTLYNTYHYFDIEDNWRKISTPSFRNVAADWTRDFHTFGMSWTTDSITWYVDGEKVHEVDEDEYRISGQAMYLLANLAVGGNWPGPADPEMGSRTFEIDYIRVYELDIPDELDLDADYQLAFSDEFDSETLDTDKWVSHYLWGPYVTINEEEQYYVDSLGSDAAVGYSPFELSDGVLSIVARPIDDPAHEGFEPMQSIPDESESLWGEYPTFRMDGEYPSRNYTSGVLTGRESFMFSKGYAEVNARIPSGSGLWPAFWLLNAYYIAQQPEIDVMEARGERPNEIEHSFHRYGQGGVLSSDSNTSFGDDYSAAFHRYGVRWERGRIDWYIDGVLVHTYEGSDVPYQLMYPILNLAVGGNFVDTVDETALPARFDVDYIRIYQGR